MVANAKRQHILPNIKDCEFMALSPGNTALLVKNSNTMVDVLDGDTLDLAFNMRCDLAKCLYLAQKLIFVGTWQNQVSVFDVQQDFKCIKHIRTKAGVRTLAQIDEDQIACGENDGFVDILSISSLSVNIGKRFEQIGHIYQVQATSLRNEIVVCSYTGVHFVKVFQDQMTGMMSLHLSPIAYITEQFVNKVIERARAPLMD